MWEWVRLKKEKLQNKWWRACRFISYVSCCQHISAGGQNAQHGGEIECGGENGGCHIRQMAQLADHAVVHAHVCGGEVAWVRLVVHALCALVLMACLNLMDMEKRRKKHRQEYCQQHSRRKCPSLVYVTHEMESVLVYRMQRYKKFLDVRKFKTIIYTTLTESAYCKCLYSEGWISNPSLAC